MFSSETKQEEKENYSAIGDRLRTEIDAQYGITRTKVEGDQYPTRVAIIRDAVQAKEISDTSIDHKQIDKNNMLLRCLGRLRGIDFVLRQMVEDKECPQEQKEILNELIKKLQGDFNLLQTKVGELADEKLLTEHLSALEKQFNTKTLCHVLHQANLDEGCSSVKDYEKLLFHYRNLSALLDPAPSLVTVSYDSANQVVHRTIQHPITKKLAEQKEAIRRSMSETVLFATGEEMSYQTKQPMAMQIANRYFAELAASDDRMLGAQARKTHLHGLKNAFLVTEELIFGVDQARAETNPLLEGEGDTTKRQSFVRSAMPVYIGSGERDVRVQASFQQNIEQVSRFAKDRLGKHSKEKDSKEKDSKQKDLQVHYTCLITDSPAEEQSFAMGHIVRGTRQNTQDKIDYSYVPCNWDGTNRFLDLSSLVDPKDRPSWLSTPSNQAARYRQAATVSRAIRQKEDVVEWVGCMSGQDRTGTEAEYASQEWVRQCYLEKKKELKADPRVGDAVEATRAKGRNPADINAHMVGGSPGCKQDSRGQSVFSSDSLFSPETDKAMYLDSARTNKANKIAERACREVMQEPSAVAEKQYEDALAKLEALCKDQAEGKESKRNPLKQAGQAVLAEVKQIKGSAHPQEVGILIRVLHEAVKVVQGPEQDARSYAAHLTRLGAIAEKLNKKPLWKKVVSALLLLGGAALIAAGFLLATPAGGTSLLFALLGAKAVATASLAKGVSLSLAGMGVTYFGSTQMKPSGLVKSMQVLQTVGKEAAYVTVPFPPSFFLQCYSRNLLGEGFADLGKLSEPQIISLKLLAPDKPEAKAEAKAEAEAEAEAKRVFKDLHRFVWEHGGKTFRLKKAERIHDYVNDLIKKMPELQLDEEKAIAILTVRDTVNGKWSQGGWVNTGAFLWGTIASTNRVLRGDGGASSIAITRNQDGSFKILSILEPKTHRKSDITFSEMSEGGNPYQYQETYTLRKKGDDWVLTLDSQNSLLVDPEVWRHMLEKATEQLAEVKAALTSKGLFPYVPLLIDKTFAAIFAKKLSHSPSLVSGEERNLLVVLIEKCHGSREKQPAHIRSIVDLLNKEFKMSPYSGQRIIR